MIYDQPRTVYILWRDAQSTDEWSEVEAVKEPPIIQTVGYLISESPTMVRVTMNLDDENELCSMTMDIPRGMIESMQTLDVDTVLDYTAVLDEYEEDEDDG
jgi:hypothetical protein